MGKAVEVKKYKSERDFERDAEKMLSKGWHIEGQSSRTKKWSLTTGIFTNKGIITVTWLRDSSAPVVAEATFVEKLAEKSSSKHAEWEAQALANPNPSRMESMSESFGVKQARKRLAKEAAANTPSQFSPDGLYWWDGSTWTPTISEDGQQRWDGQQWVPATDPANGEPSVAAAAGLDAGAPDANPTPDVASTLRQLAELRDQGLLTTAEYETKRAEVLARL